MNKNLNDENRANIPGRASSMIQYTKTRARGFIFYLDLNTKRQTTLSIWLSRENSMRPF